MANFTNHQIVTMYDNSELSIEEVAEVIDMELDAVRVALAQTSKRFRQELKEGEPGIELDVKGAYAGINSLVYCEDFGTKFRACKFVINESKGRHDRKNFRDLNVNVNFVNEAVQRAKQLSEKALEGEVIEV